MTTIHDVARRAGVSPVTVSRVINGARNVNVTTRDRVEQAIKDLGYVPNLAARSLRSRQTFTIALIVPDVTNAFWTTVSRGVEDAAQGGGYSVLLCNTDENLNKQTGYINAVSQQRVDGVIIAPYDSNAANLRQLRELHTPTVVIDRQVDGWDVDTVRSDSVSTAYALVQHLISLGHRRIALVTGPTVTSTAEERVAGYRMALEDAGIPVDPRLIRRGEYRARSGRQQTDQLFEEGLNPTAIVGANNLVAMGALESIRNHGKIVPQDIALVCFDELPELSGFYPFMTVAEQPAYDIGLNAAQLLLSRINNDAPLPPRKVILPSRLILRYSCGRMLKEANGENVHLPPLKDISETRLIRPLPNLDESRLPANPSGFHELQASGAAGGGSRFDQPDANRLSKVLRRELPDRLPHVESEIKSKSLFEYVLERSLPVRQQDLSSGRACIAPADYVEFAQRVGLDAIPCEINGLQHTGDIQDLTARMRQPPLANAPLTESFNRLEGFLRAAQGSKVGVSITFRSFFAAALQALERSSFDQASPSRQAELERQLDVLTTRQEKVIRSVCDRFAADLAFVILRDDFTALFNLGAEFLRRVIIPRFERMISPAKEHNLLVGINYPGQLQMVLPLLADTGVDLLLSVNPAENDLESLREQWKDRWIFMNCFPPPVNFSREEVEEQVIIYCQNVAKGGGHVFGLSQPVTEEVRPDIYLAMARTAHRYCVYSQ